MAHGNNHPNPYRRDTLHADPLALLAALIPRRFSIPDASNQFERLKGCIPLGHYRGDRGDARSTRKRSVSVAARSTDCYRRIEPGITAAM